MKINHPEYWTDERIKDYYDNHPNVTIAVLAAITGLSKATIKAILLNE